MTIIENVASDFDNVAYGHRQKCFERQHIAAAIVAVAYFNIPYETALRKTKESWDNHKNGFYFALHDYPKVMQNVDFNELYRQQAALSQDAKNGIVCDETIKIINKISEQYPFIFASHSSTSSLIGMGNLIGLNKSLMAHGSHGMDRLGDNGMQRKDDIHSGIYQWLCEKHGFKPETTLMIEDSAQNLPGAKMAGLQTLHIHWGNPVEDKYKPYIDFSFATNLEAFTFVENTLANDGVVQKTQLPVRKIA